MFEATRPLDLAGDSGTRARWMTTLVDLSALILSMFVLLLATRSPEVPRAPAFDGSTPAADTSPVLEPSEPAAAAGVGLTVTWLRQQLRAVGLDARVLVRAARNGVILDLDGALARSLAEPAGPPAGDVPSLAALLRGLGPDLRSVTLTYAGRGIDSAEDDLRRADLLAARLAEAGLRPYPESVVTPTLAPDRQSVELRLVLERP